MQLTFDRGSASQPRGHALLYFRDAVNSNSLLATYVVILPVAMDVTKYIPPMLASQMAEISASDFSVFAVPPVPEPMESLEHIRRLADLRDEDVVDGKSIPMNDLSQAIEVVNDAIQSYSLLYSEYVAQASSSHHAEESGTEAVSDVLYSLMSERDKLSELSKLVSTLRFASERDDARLIQDTEAVSRTLTKYMPQQYLVDRIIQSAKDPSPHGTHLTRLYLDRCYRLCDEDYSSIRDLDQAIKDLESSAT